MKIRRQPIAIRVATSKRLRRTIIGSIMGVTLIIGGGLVYTWWMGRHAKLAPQVEAATVQDSRPFFEPTAPDPRENVGVAIQALTSPLTPGSNASVSIRTFPDATCTITVTYNNVKSTDSGLAGKTADEYGTIVWSWSVESNVPIGKWPVDITCIHHEKTGYVRGDLVIVAPTS
jgi:hypothetical protein